ncbi:hypothetical protein MtrunA17_Chr7g0225831 [Medicago truncatula]|uniref:Transmembrane protein n=1 Tax=Medicago truncatula TaxID=3880 RepID=A0A396GVH0_MEDTR|nr:hypothetical protein MtrunA17_Chr7g0225831 [Medicago truncatula]
MQLRFLSIFSIVFYPSAYFISLNRRHKSPFPYPFLTKSKF